MITSKDSSAAGARDILALAQDAQNAAAKRTRWFGWCLILAGLVVIPVTLASRGPLLPFVACVVVAFSVLIGSDAFMRSRRMVPKDSKNIFLIADGIWFVLLIVIQSLVPFGASAWFLVAAVVASTPFFALGIRALTSRSRLDAPSS